MTFRVDLLDEACASDRDAHAHRRRYIDLIDTLPDEVGPWPGDPLLGADHLGPVPQSVETLGRDMPEGLAPATTSPGFGRLFSKGVPRRRVGERTRSQ